MSYQLGSMDSDQRAEIYAGPQYGERRTRNRGLIATAIGLVAAAGFAGSLWFAYVQGTKHATSGNTAADVPLIRADERPTRVKPEKPGGMEVPDRDKLIYTQKRAAVEHLLSPPEKPMPRPSAPPSAAQPELGQPAATVAPPGGPASAIQPPAQPSHPAAKPIPKTPPMPGQSAQPTAAQIPPAKTGGAKIQLGSMRSEDMARQEWDRIKRANSDLLGSLTATPIRADLGDKGVFYRVQAGPVSDAGRICQELNRRNIGCIIAR